MTVQIGILLCTYSLIAFDERVTFWLQRIRLLPCALAYVALFARRLAYNHYEIAHTYNAANAHAQGSDWARWSHKVTLVEGNQTIVITQQQKRTRAPGGVLTLERGMGMCRGHDPLFQGSRHSLAHKFTVNSPPLWPPFSIFRKFLDFQPFFGQNSSSPDPNFS